MLYWLLPLFGAYLIGSIPFAIIVCKLWGLPDPRERGSKNPGATNVLRFGSKLPAVVTLLLDGLKCFVPVYLALYFELGQALSLAIMLLVIVGHVWPVFYGFRGGKGVATTVGGYLALSWSFALSLLGVWLTVVLLSRISSLAAIITALLSPVLAWLFFADSTAVIYTLIIAIILIWRHKDNIVRLYHGREA